MVYSGGDGQFDIIFFIIEKNIYHTVNEKLYNKISGVFLFLVGVAVLIKTWSGRPILSRLDNRPFN